MVRSLNPLSTGELSHCYTDLGFYTVLRIRSTTLFGIRRPYIVKGFSNYTLRSRVTFDDVSGHAADTTLAA